MRIRPARSQDLEVCAALDHSFTTESVWQVERREENGAMTVVLRTARLPREIRVQYPRQGDELRAGWQRRDAFLVAEEGRELCGYVAVTAQPDHGIAWVGDLVVAPSWRRRGVGTALLDAAAQWGLEHGLTRLVVEVQTKNVPGARFCQSRGLTLCGYSDWFWPNQDIALFFGRALR